MMINELLDTLKIKNIPKKSWKQYMHGVYKYYFNISTGHKADQTLFVKYPDNYREDRNYATVLFHYRVIRRINNNTTSMGRREGIALIIKVPDEK